MTITDEPIMNEINVKKRNGELEPFDLEKIHKVVTWAAEGLDGVSVSQVEMQAHIQFYDGMTTKEIHEMLVKSAADLITEESPQYQYMAAHLEMFNLRKIAYGHFTPPNFYSHVKKLVEHGLYTKELIENYSQEEYEYLERFINHDRDYNFAYAGVMQMEGKYLVQNRTTHQIYETPQFLYMLVGMCLFQSYPNETRLFYVKKFYELTSTFKLSLPTPIMGGVRTPTKQFSSCVTISSGDNLNSINATASAIVKYVSQRAGIGVNVGRIRALGSPIRGGEATHTGLIPFIKYFQSAVKSCCLKPDTLVEVLEHGKIKLSELKVGDKIKSYDNGKVVFKEVTNKWNTVVPEDNRVHIHFKNGTDIFCSSNHPIMILSSDGMKEVLPYDLKEEDMVVCDSSFVGIEKVEKDLSSDENYIDIEVEGTHTFFAQNQETERNEMILTHNSQGGIRGGAATVFYPIWHYEVEDLLVLKNNRGVEDNRARQLDYGVQINGFIYNRLLKGQNVTLFSPNDVEGLYDAFFADQDRFAELYEKYEKDPTIRKKTISAVELFSELMQERASTGRIYIMNVDNVNSHGGFNPKLAPIQQSNLCVSGDTLLLTSNGYFEIKDVAGTEQEVWNGQEWSKSPVAKTGEDKEVVRVTTSNGKGLVCTPYHKWYILSKGKIKEVRTNELCIGDVLIPYHLPLREMQVGISIVSIEPLLTTEDTYCVNEPKLHRVIFNGLLTGNCMEIALPTSPINNINDGEPVKKLIRMTKEDYEVYKEWKVNNKHTPINKSNFYYELVDKIENYYDYDIGFVYVLEDFEPEVSSEISLCTLAAVNFGMIDSMEDLEEVTEVAVRALDALLDYQDYPVRVAEISTLNRRSLGIGVINYAYYLAKHGAKYSDGSGLELTHRTFEALQYYLLKASNKLAKEFGACPKFNETSYAEGKLPIDTYNKNLDKICSEPLHMNWEILREEISKYGLRNSVVSALMPSESSSTVSNSTNGIEPPRGYISKKQSKDGIVSIVVPEFERLKDNYELLWDMPNDKGYLQLVAVMQKFIDQSISANTDYDPDKYPDGKVPMNELLKDLIMAYKLGVKTLYYHNTRDGAGKETK